MSNTHLTEQTHLKIQRVTSLLKQRNQSMCTAESCTGGQLAMWFTELPGSADWYECGFVTYSNESKTALLGVAADLFASCGAVSEPVALAMANGALQHSRADIAISITGIAGPTGGTPDKPVGTVCFAVATREGAVAETKHFGSQERQAIRAQSCLHALTMVERMYAC